VRRRLLLAPLALAGGLGAFLLTRREEPPAAPSAGAPAAPLAPAAPAPPRARVTIFVAPPLLDTGGALVVAAVPVPEAAWRAIPAGVDPALPPAAVAGREEDGPGDRRFDAVAAASVTVVEIRYPEGGTYSVDVRPLPGPEGSPARALEARRVPVEAGRIEAGRMTDPETRGALAWPSVEGYAVIGPGRDADWARLAAGTLPRAFREPVAVRRGEGVRTLSLTEDQVRRLVVAPRG